MAASDWFYEIDGEERGPVDLRELRRLCEKGTIHPDDLVWTEGLADWTPARKVKDLVPRAAREQAAPRREEHQPSGSTPGIVIAGFICSFLCPLLGLILCAIGLGEAKRNRSGTGLAVAGIVISCLFVVLPILAAVAMPVMIRGRVRARAQEVRAETAIRQIVTGQSVYRDSDQDRNGIADYATGFPQLVAADLLDADLAEGIRDGYRFELTATRDAFVVQAIPQDPERAHYFADDSGVIRVEEGRRAGPSSPTLAERSSASRRDWDDD